MLLSFLPATSTIRHPATMGFLIAPDEGPIFGHGPLPASGNRRRRSRRLPVAVRGIQPSPVLDPHVQVRTLVPDER